MKSKVADTDLLDMELKIATVEAFHAQNQIIDLLSDSVNELIRLIQQHKDVDDADYAHVKEKVDEAAAIRAELNL